MNTEASYDIKVTNVEGSGQGMTVMIFRVPSVLEIDFNYLETLKNNEYFDMYEVVKGNTEVVFYWRALAPSVS